MMGIGFKARPGWINGGLGRVLGRFHPETRG